jgi:EAL domain-containing protein (putative c-di-GMP-specific phosphodiesterase class I)
VGVGRALHLSAVVNLDERPDALCAADLKQAISAGELLVYYQPTIRRFADGTWDIATVEALLRWDHELHGILSPDAFIQMGEDNNLIGLMTDYVLGRGVEQLRAWRTQRLDIGLRVNLAARLIADVTFPDRLEVLLREHEVEPEWLTLEITETGTLEQHPDTIDILTRLRVKNMNLAIDDFGIGYSSLTQLFKMPFNEMKIDKSLVMRLPEEREAAIMVEALVQLAHKLGLSVCAEGVETERALDFLGRIGCDGAQGYFISTPVPPSEVPSVLERWSHRAPVPRQALS